MGIKSQGGYVSRWVRLKVGMSLSLNVGTKSQGGYVSKSQGGY